MEQTAGASPVEPILTFGEFELDARRQELRRHGGLVALNAQPFKVLAFLAFHADEVVTREALQKHVWGDVLVEYDQGINACIRQVRAALDDDADEPRFIRTLRGTGYRFIAPVRRVMPSQVPAALPRKRAWIRIFAASTLAVAATAAWVILQPSDSLPPAAASTTLAESEALRVQGLEQLRRAGYRPSLDSALKLFSRSTRLAYSSAPPIADWSIALSFAFADRGNDSAAVLARRLLERAQALDPAGTETAIAAGFVDLFMNRRVDSAVVRFRRVIEVDSTRMLPYLGLGLAWRDQGEWAHALDALTRAAQLDSSSELAATELADALFQVRRFQDAHTVASRISVASTSARLALLRARLEIVREDLFAAIRELELATPSPRDSLLARDPVVARILGREAPQTSMPLKTLIADTLKQNVTTGENVRRQMALAEGLLRANRVDEAMNRLAWLLANPSPLNLELVERDPLWAHARKTKRYAELRQLWSR